MSILDCQVSDQNINAKEVLFNYFLAIYDIEEVLDSRLMFYYDYDNNNYVEVFKRDFPLWMWLMETYFLSNFRYLFRNWEECKKNFIDSYEELLN